MKNIFKENQEDYKWWNLRYLIIGVEDGWIEVNKEIWQSYLYAKEKIKQYEEF